MQDFWKDAPELANWIAMDDDGDWYYYEQEPEWEKNGGIYRSKGKSKFAHNPIPVLIKRPQ